MLLYISSLRRHSRGESALPDGSPTCCSLVDMSIQSMSILLERNYNIKTNIHTVVKYIVHCTTEISQLRSVCRWSRGRGSLACAGVSIL